jgi:hypothetical protein
MRNWSFIAVSVSITTFCRLVDGYLGTCCLNITEDGGSSFIRNDSSVLHPRRSYYGSSFSYFGYESILYHVNLLLGNDRETNSQTAVVTRQRPLNINKEIVFSVWSALRFYKQDR